MLSYGAIHCKTLTTGKDRYGNVQTEDNQLANTYYDAIAVYLQIQQYTNDAKWAACAQAAKLHYRDRYVLRSDVRGNLPFHWIFTRGMLLDWQLNGDATSKAAVLLLGSHSGFNNPVTLNNNTGLAASLSREVAYSLRALLHAESLGMTPPTGYPPNSPTKEYLANLMFGHVKQWFVTKSYQCPGRGQLPDPGRPATGTCADGDAFTGMYMIQPFMVGLTMEVLILYHDSTTDSTEKARALTAVQTCADWLWAHAWQSQANSFYYLSACLDGKTGCIPPTLGQTQYDNHGKVMYVMTSAAPDLNLLIAPAYAWLYLQTGQTQYRDEGDAIFGGGVQNPGVLDGSKQFNQNYITSFDYVKWRTQADTQNATSTLSGGINTLPGSTRKP